MSLTLIHVAVLYHIKKITYCSQARGGSRPRRTFSFFSAKDHNAEALSPFQQGSTHAIPGIARS